MQKALKGAQPPPSLMPFSKALKPSRVRTNSSTFLTWQRRSCATMQDAAGPLQQRASSGLRATATL